MQSHARNHVPTLARGLSAISLVFMFRTVLRTLPVGTLPRAPAGIIDTTPSVNATPSLEVFIE